MLNILLSVLLQNPVPPQTPQPLPDPAPAPAPADARVWVGGGVQAPEQPHKESSSVITTGERPASRAERISSKIIALRASSRARRP